MLDLVERYLVGTTAHIMPDVVEIYHTTRYHYTCKLCHLIPKNIATEI